ncbi:hypothetical protein pb186bvf_016570 [Paramecium bursaria]
MPFSYLNLSFLILFKSSKIAVSKGDLASKKICFTILYSIYLL